MVKYRLKLEKTPENIAKVKGQLRFLIERRRDFAEKDFQELKEELEEWLNTEEKLS
jgi:hypothetical protein